MKTYSGIIKELKENQIFVFGSNTQGKHGKGAALWALKNAGATYGIPRGLQGKSYAIVTKDLSIDSIPNISRRIIVDQIVALYDLALSTPEYEYLIAYGRGPYLNGYTEKEMAEMFDRLKIPDNIVFEEHLSKLLLWAT